MDVFRIFRDRKDRGVVVEKRLACDTLTPVQAYGSYVGGGQGFLLESIPGSYSFIGRMDSGRTMTLHEEDDLWSKLPLTGCRLRFEQDGLPPFIGGYVGYLGYDMVRGIERLPRPVMSSGFPDAKLGYVDTLVVFDHLRQCVSLLHTVPKPNVGDDEALALAREAFSPVEDALFSKPFMPSAAVPPRCHVVGAFLDDRAFLHAVDRTKEYIRDGEVIQAVLSRRLELDAACDPFDTYRRLRHINPSPYLFYIHFDDVTLVGSSPEVMVKLKGSTITSLPIAGTRPRGRSAEEDERLAEDLLNDEKERAEHLMLLDLARNDVGRVSRPGSVKVVSRELVKRYSHVMHIVSEVQGEKKPALTNIDVLKACFPAGTVSGAPKVRAMEIIDELEGMCRGPYAGAVGYLSFSGDIDTGIAIRTVFIRNERFFVQAGAGIVWDSVPENELREIDNKLKVLSAALGGMA
ncbi:MAG TPA: anthranilate synthase component I family protein [Deltaproteobacteria bacterium]|nr:anthranilate synthase component I family protein [Deltaproteobacteria bacterium]HOI05868.1 anthranilate synthase component I family protein [Deltaproteobacteria bacterium]